MSDVLEERMTTQTLRAQKAHSDRTAGRSTVPRFVYENGLSIVILGLFLASWAAQILTGYAAYNAEQQEHGQSKVTLSQYVKTGHFVEATAENWESEFLQMAVFVWFTSFLFQRGSA